MGAPNNGNAATRVGQVGGGIEAVADGKPPVVRMQSGHGLADQDRVRVGPAGTNETPAHLYYVKSSGYSPKEFALYTDSGLKTPALLDAPPGAQVYRLAAEDWAVVAGVNLYLKHSELKGAVGDAHRFSQWLKDVAYLPDDQILEVPASPSLPARPEDIRPTFEDGKSPFQRLSELAGDKDLHHLGRRLYIFMSGHGILPAGGDKVEFAESALLMAKTNLYDHIAGRAHAELFRGPGVFNEVVLFMDCCRDWMGGIAMTKPMIPVFPVDQRPPGRKFYVLATQLDSTARESDKLCPPETRGVFTHVLLEALASPGLCDRDGNLTGKILADRVKKDVFDKTQKQIPEPDYDPDFVFLRRPPPPKPKVRVTFGAAVHGQTFDLRGGTNYPDPDDTHVAGAQPWIAELTGEGHIWRLKSRETGNITDFELDPSKEEVDVNIP